MDGKAADSNPVNSNATNIASSPGTTRPLSIAETPTSISSSSTSPNPSRATRTLVQTDTFRSVSSVASDITSASPIPSAAPTINAAEVTPIDSIEESEGPSSLLDQQRRLSLDEQLGLLDLAKANAYVGLQNHSIRPTEDIFNANEPRIKEDIIRMIAQYLSDEGYQTSKMTVLDEATVKWYEREEQQADAKRIRKAILEGDWAEAEKIFARPMLKNQKGFLYAMYKAFTFLNKRLKPLENLQTTPTEFKDLCYLLTAKAVTDVPSFKNWEGVGPARERLAEQFQNMLEFENADRQGSVFVPPHRLLELLRQAVAYQIEFARYHPRIAPKVSTLLQDYTSVVIPNAIRHNFTGHTGNVKCVDFVGDDGKWIVSGSSDNTVRVWDLETAMVLSVLEGHTSRIWDVASSRSGARVASASGDGTVKIWDMKLSTRLCLQTLKGAVGDVYAVKFHPSGTHVATGGYDRAVRLYDLERGVAVKTFTGHQLSVSRTVFSPLGNLIVSGSKDSTIRFWDVVSGLCIRTITSHLGEVTSVEMSSDGREMLSCSKDNSNRLWDLRMTRPIRRFKGHQNTSKNFVRAGFMGDAIVVGGSEDGIVYLWDRDTGNILQTLPAHDGVAYSGVWNTRQSLLLSCEESNPFVTLVLAAQMELGTAYFLNSSTAQEGSSSLSSQRNDLYNLSPNDTMNSCLPLTELLSSSPKHSNAQQPAGLSKRKSTHEDDIIGKSYTRLYEQSSLDNATTIASNTWFEDSETHISEVTITQTSTLPPNRTMMADFRESRAKRERDLSSDGEVTSDVDENSDAEEDESEDHIWHHIKRIKPSPAQEDELSNNRSNKMDEDDQPGFVVIKRTTVSVGHHRQTKPVFSAVSSTPVGKPQPKNHSDSPTPSMKNYRITKSVPMQKKIARKARTDSPRIQLAKIAGETIQEGVYGDGAADILDDDDLHLHKCLPNCTHGRLSPVPQRDAHAHEHLETARQDLVVNLTRLIRRSSRRVMNKTGNAKAKAQKETDTFMAKRRALKSVNQR
ncbi:hypothetical protein SmJEL517_g02468 [Synchytrium microbalum]|uniref:WD40 repeat-containing protein SMU1 n=1 Tax=Synchytrium microbalum TaxID=1806994 RepID=A0A507C799_9FUNG|nr:uncharacterized protein SmJEL517_g02468 [Synchytrium microbalum]TPX35009.1 hypothetical protein SmJEL517_g02468 [Synchytrium microbalum]